MHACWCLWNKHLSHLLSMSDSPPPPLMSMFTDPAGPDPVWKPVILSAHGDNERTYTCVYIHMNMTIHTCMHVYVHIWQPSLVIHNKDKLHLRCNYQRAWARRLVAEGPLVRVYIYIYIYTHWYTLIHIDNSYRNNNNILSICIYIYIYIILILRIMLIIVIIMIIII